MIYYFVPTADTIFMIFVYSKDEADELAADQRKTLKILAQSIANQYRTK